MAESAAPEVVFRADAVDPGLLGQFVQSPWFAMGAILVVAVIAVCLIQLSTRIAIRTIRAKVKEALAEVDVEPPAARRIEIRTTGIGRHEIGTSDYYLSFSHRNEGAEVNSSFSSFVGSLKDKLGEGSVVVVNEEDEDRSSVDLVVLGQEVSEIVAAAKEAGLAYGLVAEKLPMTIAVAKRVAERAAVKDAARSLPVLQMVSGLSPLNAEVIRVDVESVPGMVESIVVKKVTLTWSVAV